MRMKLLLTFAFIIGLSSVQVIAQSQAAQNFGDTFEAKKVMNYDKFLKKVAKKGGLEDVVIKGEVAAVCQMKGCWMNIISSNAKQPETFVKFKDYGFFVPMDISGQTVVMKGDAYMEVTSVDELKHMAEDAGKSKAEIDAITAPKEELKFMASGVQVLPKK